MAKQSERVDYEKAGFNGFLRRTIASSPTETSLKNLGANRTHKPQGLNFDGVQTSGNLGDVIRVGSAIEIAGSRENINIRDAEGNEVGRFGNMET